MSIYSNKPYTYLIGWSKYNRWYYGVRYAKTCDPSDLWVTYFTSSKYVSEFRTQFGDPDIIQIRKVFNDTTSARDWEHKVLKRLVVVSSDKWLNKSDNKVFDPVILSECKIGKNNPMYGKTGVDHPWYGNHHTDETKNKMSNQKRGNNHPFCGKLHKEVICPKCGEVGPINMMKRWHFDNCNVDRYKLKAKTYKTHKPLNKRVNVYIFVNLISGEYVYSSMADFARYTDISYKAMSMYFPKGKVYKSWIRL